MLSITRVMRLQSTRARHGKMRSRFYFRIMHGRRDAATHTLSLRPLILRWRVIFSASSTPSSTICFTMFLGPLCHLAARFQATNISIAIIYVLWYCAVGTNFEYSLQSSIGLNNKTDSFKLLVDYQWNFLSDWRFAWLEKIWENKAKRCRNAIAGSYLISSKVSLWKQSYIDLAQAE